MIYFIYKLVDPRTDQPFYVGFTGNPNMRVSKHRTEKDGATRKNQVIKEIQSAGLQPRMDIIETVTDNLVLAREREQHWMQNYEEQGIALANVQFSSINRPVTEITVHTRPKREVKSKKPKKWVRLTFDRMDDMWEGYIEKNISVPLLDNLESFLGTFPDELPTAREKLKFEIWRDCKRSQIRHPENFPFCNI